MKRVPRVLLVLGTLCLLFCHPAERPLQAASWADDALLKEADFIADCSFSESARNNQEVQPSDDAYGAVNVVRIYLRGADWVPPGEASMGVIGLMAAATHLKQAGYDTARYERVLDRFFHTWIVERRQPINGDAGSDDFGGCFERVYYDTAGHRQRQDWVNAGVTGQMIAAMWKYYEFNVATGSVEAANNWLQEGWPVARLAGEFLQRHYDAQYHLERSNAQSRDLWVSDSTYTAMALRCLDRWAAITQQERSYDYLGTAHEIEGGLQLLKDDSTRKCFFRYRDSKGQAFQPTYGDRIDQLCFLPYEADVLDAGDSFARKVSDWWTNGSDGIQMTYLATDPKDWRHYGTHLRHFFKPNLENDNLYPGPGLQLAKMEWKYAQKTGDSLMLQRARMRLDWARSSACSNLWLGNSTITEANVPNGLVDWRDSTNYGHKADTWQRFADTSAYFIEAVLMLEYGVDTKYVPS